MIIVLWMEPEKFCSPCDSKSDGKRACVVEEFYPRKGYCPAASIAGTPVLMDCLNVYSGRRIIPREDALGLLEVVLMSRY